MLKDARPDIPVTGFIFRKIDRIDARPRMTGDNQRPQTIYDDAGYVDIHLVPNPAVDPMHEDDHKIPLFNITQRVSWKWYLEHLPRPGDRLGVNEYGQADIDRSPAKKG